VTKRIRKYVHQPASVVTDGTSGGACEVGAGDVIGQPKGWSCRLDVTETIRTLYSI
jgi:hypothetical protein